MSLEEWIAQALEDAPPITPEQAATLWDLLADARDVTS